MLRLLCAAVVLLQIGALGCGDQAGVGGNIVYVPGPTCIAFCAQVVDDWLQQTPPEAFPCRAEVTTVDTVCFSN